MAVRLARLVSVVLHCGVRSLDQEGTNDPAAGYAINAVPPSNSDVVLGHIRVSKDGTVVGALFRDIFVLNNMSTWAQRTPANFPNGGTVVLLRASSTGFCRLPDHIRYPVVSSSIRCK